MGSIWRSALTISPSLLKFLTLHLLSAPLDLPFNHLNNPFAFIVGKPISKPEDYSDVRGSVTADYQEFLEKEWIKMLRAKYPVKVNDDILKTVKKN